MIDLSTISSELRRGEDGIWRAASNEVVSYPADAHNEYAALEDVSFWFRHRNRCILAMLDAHPISGTIFDIGGGNGYVAAAIARAGLDVVLVEPGAAGINNAKQRGVSQLVCATTATAGFAPGSMPAIGLFDVIEHIEDDIVFLRSMAKLLEGGGALFATVPAHNWLWSEEDERAGHFRRYTLDGLRATTEAAGLEIVYLSYFFRPLPLAILLFRAAPFWLGRRRVRVGSSVSREHVVGGTAASFLLDAVLAREVKRVRSSQTMSLGGSILLAARKPPGHEFHSR